MSMTNTTSTSPRGGIIQPPLDTKDRTSRKIIDAMKMVREEPVPEIQDLLGDGFQHNLDNAHGNSMSSTQFGPVNRSPSLFREDSFPGFNSGYSAYFAGQPSALLPGSNPMQRPSNNRIPSAGSMRTMQLPGSFGMHQGSRSHLGAHGNSMGSFPMIPNIPSMPHHGIPNHPSYGGRPAGDWDPYPHQGGPPGMMNNVELSPMMPKNSSVQNVGGSNANLNPGSPRVKTKQPWLQPGQMSSQGLPSEISSYGQFLTTQHSAGGPLNPMVPSNSSAFMNPAGTAGGAPFMTQNNSNISLPGMMVSDPGQSIGGELGSTSTGPPLGLDLPQGGHHSMSGYDLASLPYAPPMTNIDMNNQPPVMPDPIVMPPHSQPPPRPSTPQQQSYMGSSPPRGGHRPNVHRHERGGRMNERRNDGVRRGGHGGRPNRHNGDFTPEENTAPGHSKLRGLNLQEVIPMLGDLCTDQNGSRKIQQALQCDSRAQRESNVQLILDNIDLNLICDDIFGNYVVQRCAEYGSDAQRTAIVKILGDKIADYAVKMCGCRVIQAIIEHADHHTNAMVFDAIKPKLLEMVTSQNGNHVVQKAILNMETSIVAKIVDILHQQTISFARHGYGCRVMQRLLEKAEQDALIPTFTEIMRNASSLVSDQYGNYVLQHIACYGREEEKTALQDLILSDFVRYAKEKFASNVVEKCFKHIDIPQTKLLDLIESLDRSSPSPRNSVIVQLMTDKFANYVMQALFKSLDEDGKFRLFQSIESRIGELLESNHGKHIVGHMEAAGLLQLRD